MYTYYLFRCSYREGGKVRKHPLRVHAIRKAGRRLTPQAVRGEHTKRSQTVRSRATSPRVKGDARMPNPVSNDAAQPWMTPLRRCLEVLSAQPGVGALILGGSGATPETMDAWSDLDVVVVAEPAQAAAMFADRRWLDELGTTFAMDASTGSDRWTIRVCFADLTRIDFILAGEAALPALRTSGPLRHGERLVLGAIDGGGTGHPSGPGSPAPKPAADDVVARLEGGLRWNAVLAAVKVARGDLLIGSHLALATAQAPLVLAMLLRDRQTGTDHHRCGDGAFPSAWTRPLPAVADATGVLDLLAWAADAWSALMPQWDPTAHTDLRPLHTLLARARGSLAGP